MRIRTLILTLVCALVTGSLVIVAGPRDAQWKKVDEAMKKGLPKSAIEQLQPIIDAAIKEQAYPEAVKAIAQKIALEGNIQGNKPEEKITRLEAEIAKAPVEMRPIMQALLGHWYWHYFQNNRFRFMRRTATAEAPGKDFTTWDLPRLFKEIDQHFVAALTAEKQLQSIPIASYDALLVKGTVSDAYRPTLYDFIAQQALEFYSSGEQAGAKAEDDFVLSADSPIFGATEDFLAWKIETTDEDSRIVKSIRLMHQLMQFHLAVKEPSARLDVDLQRLVFGSNTAFGEEKSARYKAALKRFSERWGDHEISARSRALWAAVVLGEGEPAAAREIALAGVKAYPDSVGGRMCHNLIQQIEAKASSVTTDRVWAEPWPTIDVSYRNINELHFRLVKSDWPARLGAGRWRPEQLNDPDRKSLLAQKPVREWTAKLPPTDDFAERHESLPLPDDLAPGFYFLISSHTRDFGVDHNVVTFTDVWVSKLALVVRSRWGDDKIEGFVLDSKTGEARPAADVQTWFRANNNSFSAGPTVKTDKNGFFSVAGRVNSSVMLMARDKDDTLAAGNDYYANRNVGQNPPNDQTIFFTDRSIYRPGQTIQYKGLCIHVDQAANDYSTIAGRKLAVLFVDANGKEIARRDHATNDYGSFSGSFTAPRDRLMGAMTIRVAEQPTGATSVSVEEYKRPKFQVTLDAPKTAAKLNAAVSLQGKAIAYTGAAIDNAKVKYRVIREVRYPAWWGWMYWWRTPNSAAQEIAHGTAVSGTDGTFKIEFVAKPDPSVAEKDEPTFHYAVSADVTDSAGETRSGQRSINVGYTALQATLVADEWQTDEKPVEIKIATQTLDGEGQKAEGSLKIYRLRQPDKVVRPSFQGYRPPTAGRGARGRLPGRVPAPENPKPDPSNPNSWENGELVFEQGFNSDDAGKAQVATKLAAGIYRAVLDSQDRFGKQVTARLPLQVLKPAEQKFSVKIPNLVAAPKWTLEPGEEFVALWGSGYDTARAFVEIEHRQQLVQAFWTEPGQTQATVKVPVIEGMRGGFTLRVSMVRENRVYFTTRQVTVPWTNKNLTVKWEHFVSKLGPGQKETWTAVISGPDAKRAVAEMVAGLYDQSLDAYRPHDWPAGFQVFRADSSNLYWQFENSLHGLGYLHGQYPPNQKDATLTYRGYPPELVANLWGYQYFGRGRGAMLGGAASGAAGAPEAAASRRELSSEGLMQNGFAADGAALRKSAGAVDRLALGEADKQGTGLGVGAPGQPGPDLSQVSARKNLNETAFFFPHLVSDENGVVKLEFTMPEALTQWKFLGFVHDRNLRGGLLTDKVVTAKDLMVQPNPPRFLREGDLLEFTVKVSNQSSTSQSGKVKLSLADARTAQSVDAALGLEAKDLDFDIPAGESRSLAWRLKVPDGMGPVTYKTVGSTGRLSDGEEGALPILSRRVLVTESLPLPIRGAQTKKFDFEKLRKSGDSQTLKHQSLTVQMVSNPSWYAIMALPYLMEFPHECTEQTFNRFYANALAQHIALSDPKIRRIFDQWKGTPALDSPLEKNQDLKSVLIEETPWLRQANAESQSRRNVGVLFDDNRLNDETTRNLRKLADAQYADGAWPWFPGGPANDYITLYITTGFGRMRHLGVKFDTAPAVKSLDRLDAWIDRVYRDILAHGQKDKYHLSTTVALYLYGRSFFLEDKPIPPTAREAVDYFLAQAREHWLKLDNRQSQAHLAVALKRFGSNDAAQGIMNSIKERSVSNEEFGMFWRETELSWWWYRAPIETQAMMIEAFDEVMGDKQAVEDCKVWLLKQKQTQDWKTTKATADAVYALMLRGDNLLASDALVEVALAGQKIEPEKVEAGTGFYEQKFIRGEVKPQFGEITVKKTDPGVAWGSVHWQYLEDMTKVTPYEGTPLRLKKSLFIKEHTKKGPVLKPAAGMATVGDELVVRVELRTDRDMEFVHLKDYRGSGTEPVSVLSQYRYQDGLAYYETTRDTASHFFIDYLPKGTYVFEYSTRVVHRGEYQSGMAEIQCMYAPEFNSHSESFLLKVQ